MRLAHLGGCFAFLAQALVGQSWLAQADRQEILVEGQVLRRTSTEPAFAPVPDLPDIRPSLRFLGNVEVAWDGARVTQVGITEDHRRVVSVGTPYFTTGGERRWFWTEPKALTLPKEDAYTLVGAWEDSLLFLVIHQETKATPTSIPNQKAPANVQGLLRADLTTNAVTRLLDLQGGKDFRSTALFSQDAFYLFTASGTAIRVGVRTEPWGVDTLSANFWGEAGVTLCKDTGEFRNPVLFGKAFLDLDGSVLIPTQVFLPLDREDIDLAWSKLPQSRKAELIGSGQWPVPAGQEIGWKDDVRFLRFDPLARTFSQVDRARFEHLVVEEDKHFMIRRFREFEPARLYTSSGGKILPLEEAMRTPEAVPVGTVPKGKEAANGGPAPLTGPVRAKAN